jgi:glycosyltransferase involved in cell wall biosynthesis
MKILLLNYEYPPLGGGGGLLTRTLAQSLATTDSVTVLTSGTPALRAKENDDGVEIVRVPILGRKQQWHASPLSLASFPLSVAASSLKKVPKPDLVHSHFAIPTGPAGVLLAKRFRIPHILTVHGGDIHNPTRRVSPDQFWPLRTTVRAVARSCSVVTAVSRDLAARVAVLSGRDDVVVVPNGIGTPSLPQPDRTSLGWSADDVVVVTTGRLNTGKSVETLIRAASYLPENVRIEIIGDGPDREQLEDLAAASAHRIVVTGWLTKSEMDLRLVSADIYCQPSLYEGFGLALLEAMQTGLPVVATDAGGPRDFVQEGVNGYLTVPQDVSMLADRLRQLVEDPPRRREMGGAARATAEAYSAKVMSDGYRQVYERALHG